MNGLTLKLSNGCFQRFLNERLIKLSKNNRKIDFLQMKSSITYQMMKYRKNEGGREWKRQILVFNYLSSPLSNLYQLDHLLGAFFISTPTFFGILFDSNHVDF